MERRNFAAVVLTAPLLAASCAPSASDNTAVGNIVDAVGKWMPWVNALALGISVLVPQTTPFVPLVERAIQAVYDGIVSVQATMTASAARPVLARVELDMSAGLQLLDKMVEQVPEVKGKAKFQAMLAEAEAVLAQVETLVNNSVATMPTTRAAPRHLWLRAR